MEMRASELLLTAIVVLALALKVRSCEVTETCTFNKPEKHKQNASIGEFTSYITRKSSCVLIVLKANKQSIDTIGQKSTGHAQFVYTPNILQNQPYPTKQVIIYNTSCPSGQLAYVDLLQLDLEPHRCEDYIGVHLPTPHHIIGNNITASGTPLIGNISHLLFRSDNSNVDGRTGFKGYLQCFDPSTANMEGCTGKAKSRNVKSYLPGGRDQGDLRKLREAAFDAVVSTPRRDITDTHLQLALKHNNSCNAVLRALAKAVINYHESRRPVATPPPGLVIVKPPVTVKGSCVNTTANFPKCAAIGYSSTFLPNLEQKTDDVLAINDRMSEFDDLIYRNQCSNALFHLVCLVYAPVCITDKIQHKVCWRLCDYVKTGCATNFEKRRLPPLLECNNPDVYSNESTSICPPVFTALQLPGTAAVTPPPPATPTSVSLKDSIRRPPDEDRVCVDIDENELSICSNLTWTRAFFPNFEDHKTQKEAAQFIKESQFELLIQSGCSEDIHHLVCSFFAPICPNNNPVVLYPCRWWCEKVKAACSGVIPSSATPSFFHCDTFPTVQPCFFVGIDTSTSSP